MITTEVMTITKAGQVTIPKEIRDLIKTNSIAFEILDNNQIHLIPIKSVAGALNEFAKPNSDFSTIRENVWETQTEKFRK